jgi:hypothetical protein
MTEFQKLLALRIGGISGLISGLALTTVGGLYVTEAVVDGKSMGLLRWLTLIVGLFNIGASVAILFLVAQLRKSGPRTEQSFSHLGVSIMSKTTSYLPAASCGMAIGALALALLSWAMNVERLQPGLALICLVLTIASLVSAIVGIIVFRRGPRRLAVTAWIGLFLNGFPILYWGFWLGIILNNSGANPF